MRRKVRLSPGAALWALGGWVLSVLSAFTLGARFGAEVSRDGASEEYARMRDQGAFG